ncbi:MAG: S-methyl-5-thioribose-1-phosphate isomerase [Deltaproteobacteria bacterium]|nr:S-methyl-5-thioribose-1-phosphate isomerase [Deltaproteobacteria bacterium]
MTATIEWIDDKVVLLDQRFLPREERYVAFADYRDIIASIRNLAIRGAPAIAIAAAMGIALAVLNVPAQTMVELRESFASVCRDFASARPTAVNLFWAIERMKRRFDRTSGDSLDELRQALKDEALTILAEDIAANREIGRAGSALISDGEGILTHCNAGALATGGYGTALGVIRAAWEAGKRVTVYVDETRPVLQGARLTAWELHNEGIPAVLITDGMAASLMKRGLIRSVIVGADRIAANGDTANKIGTYGLALLARDHGIPFYVAAPRSSIDMAISRGEDIPIEERDPSEVTHIQGIPIAPAGIAVMNPAFDVTPSGLIGALITEAGVLHRPTAPGIASLFECSCYKGESQHSA